MKTDYVRVPLQLKRDQYTQLTEHTRKNGQTTTGAIRIAIDQYLEKEGEKKDK